MLRHGPRRVSPVFNLVIIFGGCCGLAHHAELASLATSLRVRRQPRHIARRVRESVVCAAVRTLCQFHQWFTGATGGAGGSVVRCQWLQLCTIGGSGLQHCCSCFWRPAAAWPGAPLGLFFFAIFLRCLVRLRAATASCGSLKSDNLSQVLCENRLVTVTNRLSNSDNL